MAAEMLRFEIWKDAASHSHQMTMVTLDSDVLRRSVSPDAVLVHTFEAASNFDAFQKNHDWNGFGVWKPPTDVNEEFFAEEELSVQQAYLAVRQVS